MTESESEQTANPWQEPPEGLLQGIFEFFLTLEDGEPLVSSPRLSMYEKELSISNFNPT